MNIRTLLTTSTTLVAAGVLLILPACTAPSNSSSAPSEASETASPKSNISVALRTQNQAQDILNTAIEAAGGIEALDTLREGSITLSVRAARVGQGPTPDADGELGNASKTVGLRANGMTAIERFNGDNLGSRYVRGELVDWIYFARQNSVADVEPSLAAGIISQVNSSGHILLELYDRSQNLRAGETIQKDGKSYKTLSYANTLGQLETLYFDAATGHLSGIEQVGAHAQWGDVVSKRRFSDYKDMNGVTVAQTVSTYQAGKLRSEVKLESLTNAAIDASIFEKPEDATVNDPFTGSSPAPRDLEVETLADDIYFIENAAQGYNVIFADQSDGILILETPQSPQASRDVLRTIKAKFPNKTIKAAVPTHHHFDHSGGLYGYLEAGVPILTTPGNVDFVTGVGTASRKIGANAGKAENVSVSSFDKARHMTGEGGNQVELINVGPNPHAEEIVVMYIPAIDAVFVADVFSRRGDTLPPANANQLAFADHLEEIGLDPKTFIPVHGTNATKEEFWDSVKRGREAAEE